MTIREAIKRVEEAAEEIYERREAQQIARYLVMECGGYTPTQLIVNQHDECQIERFEDMLQEISSGRPLQYVVGKTEFCSITLNVKEGVLIPRPETEELVMWIVAHYQGQEPHIIDVGTGSGAIAIALNRELEGSRVWGVDLSREAISQATLNNEINGASVEFVEGDALRGVEHLFEGMQVDVVVSNPPYIPCSELKDMRRNVVDFEPHLALFVEDSDPLIFYRQIALSAQKLLKPSGRLYFEIHESFAQQIVEMLNDMGYKNIVCRDDINQKPRMICAQK